MSNHSASVASNNNRSKSIVNNYGALPIVIIVILGFVWAVMAASRGGDPVIAPHAYMFIFCLRAGHFCACIWRDG